MASRTIPESAIPFTAKRVKTVSNTGSNNNNAHSSYQNGSIEWSDLTKEPLQPEIGHLHAEEGINDGLGHNNATVLPEDDLENLLALPLGQDLRSRRSKTSLASATSSTSNRAFPASTSKEQLSQIPVQQPVRKDSLRKRAQSIPMKATSSSQSTSSSASASSKKQRRLGDATIASPTQTSPSASPRLGPSSSSTPRARAVTNNVNQGLTPKKSPVLASSPSTSTSKRPLQSAKPPHKQTSTPVSKKATSTSPSRSRSQSASRNKTDSALYSQFDADSKPPWLDQSTPLYRSDITAPEPGSLADLARHAQSKMHGSAASEEAGNTSTRSWDDVILPAVAKQIRAQRLLEAQQREAQNAQRPERDRSAGEARAAPFSAEDVDEPGPGKTEPFQAILPPDLSARSGSEQAQPSPAMYLRPSESLSSRQRTLSRGQANGSNLSLSPSTASQSHSNRTHHTGRQELWQQTPLSSPTVAKENGFAQQQQQQQCFGALGQPSAKPASSDGRQTVTVVVDEKQKEKLRNDDDKHSKGCRCVIM